MRARSRQCAGRRPQLGLLGFVGFVRLGVALGLAAFGRDRFLARGAVKADQQAQSRRSQDPPRAARTDQGQGDALGRGELGDDEQVDARLEPDRRDDAERKESSDRSAFVLGDVQARGEQDDVQEQDERDAEETQFLGDDGEDEVELF